MIKALSSLQAQMDKSPKLQMILEELQTEVEGGSSLSEAMVDQTDSFDEAEIGMIQSGEASGQLSRVLDNLAADAEKAVSIKGKVKSAMMYPTIIFLALIAVIVAMMIFVIPKLTELFDAVEGELPLPTRVVIGLSDFFRNISPYVIILCVILLVLSLIASMIILFRTKYKINVE